jgi:hypothetical protein
LRVFLSKKQKTKTLSLSLFFLYFSTALSLRSSSSTAASFCSRVAQLPDRPCPGSRWRNGRGLKPDSTESSRVGNENQQKER